VKVGWRTVVRVRTDGARADFSSGGGEAGRSGLSQVIARDGATVT
jgi:hypothetical protein